MFTYLCTYIHTYLGIRMYICMYNTYMLQFITPTKTVMCIFFIIFSGTFVTSTLLIFYAYLNQCNYELRIGLMGHVITVMTNYSNWRMGVCENAQENTVSILSEQSLANLFYGKVGIWNVFSMTLFYFMVEFK